MFLLTVEEVNIMGNKIDTAYKVFIGFVYIFSLGLIGYSLLLLAGLFF